MSYKYNIYVCTSCAHWCTDIDEQSFRCRLAICSSMRPSSDFCIDIVHCASLSEDFRLVLDWIKLHIFSSILAFD